MKRSHQIAVVTIGLLAGIIAQANLTLHLRWWLLALAVVLVTLAVWRAKRLIALALIPLSLLAGCWYFGWWNTAHNLHSVAALVGQKAELQGRVSGTPFWDQYGSYTYTLTDLQKGGQKLSGKLKISSQLGNVQEGYVVQVSGKLYHSASADAQMIYADGQVISRNQPWLVRIKENFRRGLAVALPKPTSQFVEGIMIGNRSTLPVSIQNDLNAAGLSHIIAVSGYNLTILIMLFHKLVRSRWKWLNLVSSLWLILGFVVLTGAVASIVRAGIMTALFLLSRYYGKRLSVISALLLTALVTVLLNPSYLLSDIGWRLSFASLTGIVLFTEPLLRLLPKKLPKLSEIAATTLAAQVFTFPLIAYTFGQLSIAAPVANLLVMPAIPILMAAGLVAGVVGMVAPVVAAPLFVPLSTACRWLLGLIHWLASRPFAAINVTAPAIGIVLSYYAAILVGWVIVMRPKSVLRYNEIKESA